MELENGKPTMKVMVVIDETECSYYALTWALNNLKDSVKNLQLVILAAQPPPNSNYVVSSAIGFARFISLPSARMDLVKSAQKQSMKVSLALLEKAESVCAIKGVKAETIAEVGEPQELIVNAVQNHKINMLVIGNPDAGSTKRTFLGTLSNFCSNNVNCPVLVVKKED